MAHDGGGPSAAAQRVYAGDRAFKLRFSSTSEYGRYVKSHRGPAAGGFLVGVGGRGASRGVNSPGERSAIFQLGSSASQPLRVSSRAHLRKQTVSFTELALVPGFLAGAAG